MLIELPRYIWYHFFNVLSSLWLLNIFSYSESKILVLDTYFNWKYITEVTDKQGEGEKIFPPNITYYNMIYYAWCIFSSLLALFLLSFSCLTISLFLDTLIFKWNLGEWIVGVVKSLMQFCILCCYLATLFVLMELNTH